MFDCAAGCGAVGSKASQTLSSSLVPPAGWITIGLDTAMSEPPFQARDGQYSAVVCTMDCAISFLTRTHRMMQLSVAPSNNWKEAMYQREETRIDIAKRIGFAILEAIEEVTESSEDKVVLLPLDMEENQLHTNVCLAFLPFDMVAAEELTNETEE